METLPHGFEANDIWVLDKAITQSELGVGAFERATGVSATFSAPPDDERVAVEADDARLAVDCEILPEHKEPQEQLSSSGLSSQRSADFSKLLCTENVGNVSREDVFEDIAKETKLAADSCRYYSEHIQDASTIECWLRAYVSHIYKLHEEHAAGPSSDSAKSTPAFVDTLPEYVKRYVGFVVNILLSSPCRYCLDKFTFQFEQLDEICPQLLPPMARALEMLTGDMLCVMILLWLSVMCY